MENPNAPMSEYWNGPGGERWIAAHDKIERSLAPITELLFAFASPKPGERVVDIGCGLGKTTAELARRTGAATLGVDVSVPMVKRAQETLMKDDVGFVAADASAYAFDGTAQLVFSRFGVMFFGDPVAAFTHLRTAAAPGGRLAFVCWRAFAENPWAFAPFMAGKPLLPPQEPMDPNAPGPFAFADSARLREILERAGWKDVVIEGRDSTMHIGDTLVDAVEEAMTVGPLARASDGLDETTRGNIKVRVAEALQRFETKDGVAPPAAVWLVGAKA
jgi:SAM-dependent methyltransferase